MIKKVIQTLEKSNIFLYSILIWTITFVIRGGIHCFIYIFNISDVEFHEQLINKEFEVNIDLLLDALLLAPILETLVFQTLFFVILKQLRVNKLFIVILSALAFGSTHYYSLFYIIDTIFIGAIFMYGYMLR